jgi:hypothetical protein
MGGVGAGPLIVLAAGGFTALLVAGIGLAVAVASSARLAVALWRSWRAWRWRRKHRGERRPDRGERPLPCLEEARYLVLARTWADKEATRKALAAEREQRERMEASEDA